MPTYPIVGGRHHPPAVAIMDFMAVGTPLILVAEPTNQYDVNAIMVILETKHINEVEGLDDALAGYGTNTTTVKEGGRIHLGYIPKDLAAYLRIEVGFPTDREMTGTFTVSSNGKPNVRWEGMPAS